MSANQAFSSNSKNTNKTFIYRGGSDLGSLGAAAQNRLNNSDDIVVKKVRGKHFADSHSIDNFYKEGSGKPTIDDGFTVVGRESKVVEHGFVSVLKTADSAVEFGLETGADFVKDTVKGAIKSVINPFNYLP